MSIHRVPRGSGVTRPKVLLVDDHRAGLERVSALLADVFDLAAVETNPGQAVDIARRVAFGLIVHDINMPGLDGSQIKRALDGAGSRAPVLLLSATEDDDHIAAAFRCGGHGSVNLEPTAIESQWNRVTEGLPFLTLCGYAASSLQDCAPEIWSTAFLAHSAVSHATAL